MHKNKRIISLAIAAIIMCFILCSCGGPAAQEESVTKKETPKTEDGMVPEFFVLLRKAEMSDDGMTQFIFYDPDTGVMWTMLRNGNSCGFTPLMNPDKTLRVYNPETDSLPQFFVLLRKAEMSDDGMTQFIFYDPDTGVMWTMLRNGNSCGFTPLVNPDLTLKVYAP
ncbi:MAG: hypothetical protein K6D97_01370 [Clostridia bacterium]|nr:hypothetical protein [Clostridia bacterium]